MTTETHEQLKQLVKQEYTHIAEQSKEENETACGETCGCATIDYTFMEEYVQYFHIPSCGHLLSLRSYPMTTHP